MIQYDPESGMYYRNGRPCPPGPARCAHHAARLRLELDRPAMIRVAVPLSLRPRMQRVSQPRQPELWTPSRTGRKRKLAEIDSMRE